MKTGHLPQPQLWSLLLLLCLGGVGLVWIDTSKPAANNPGAARPVALPPPLLGGLLFRLATVRDGTSQFGRPTANWIAYSPDGTTLGMTDSMGSFVQWQAADGTAIRRIHTSSTTEASAGSFTLFAFTPDGKSVITGSYVDICVRTWDLQSRREIRRVPGEKVRSWNQLNFSPDGSRFAVETDRYPQAMSAIAVVQVRSTASGEVIHKYEVQLDYFRLAHLWFDSPGLVTFAPGGKMLAIEPRDRQIYFLDCKTGKKLGKVIKDDDCANFLSFNPDGKILASAGGALDHRGRLYGLTIHFWEVASGKEVRRLVGHKDLIMATAFSPDGRTFASASKDRTVRLWETATGKELLCLTDLDGENEPKAIAFSPDGYRLASAMQNGEALIWSLAPADWHPPRMADARQLIRLWVDLASGDAPQAYRSVWTLSSAPVKALPFLKARLQSPRQVSRQRVEQLIADLDAKEFQTREDAALELANLGPQAEAALLKAAASGKSLEVTLRIQRLLKDLVKDPEALRIPRAVWVLERIGTPAARDLLAELAKGAPDARLTQEAQAALRRLKR